jgi:hypothetical protein
MTARQDTPIKKERVLKHFFFYSIVLFRVLKKMKTIYRPWLRSLGARRIPQGMAATDFPFFADTKNGCFANSWAISVGGSWPNHGLERGKRGRKIYQRAGHHKQTPPFPVGGETRSNRLTKK